MTADELEYWLSQMRRLWAELEEGVFAHDRNKTDAVMSRIQVALSYVSPASKPQSHFPRWSPSPRARRYSTGNRYANKQYMQ